MRTTFDGLNYNLEFETGKTLSLTGSEITEFNDWLKKHADDIKEARA